jgi:hypothetical protein
MAQGQRGSIERPQSSRTEKLISPVLMQTETGHLTRKGKLTAFALIVAGLLTFFVPMIKFDPPMLGRRYWSVWEMVRRSDNQVVTEILLPSSLLVASAIPFEWIYVTYAVFIVAMGALLLFPFSQRADWNRDCGSRLPFVVVWWAVRTSQADDDTCVPINLGRRPYGTLGDFRHCVWCWRFRHGQMQEPE